jgi:hypothetical protein
MYLLDYAFYMYWKQFEMFWLSLASKLGLHPVAIAPLSPNATSLVDSQIPNGGSKDIGTEYMNAIHIICPTMFYRCIMDKKNHLQLILASRAPFLLLS